MLSGPTQARRVVAAFRSVTESTGESDLEVFLADDAGETTCLLIENKVHARFQPQQAGRYQQRGKSYIAAGRCSAFVTVLVAPTVYLGSSSADSLGFQAHLSYEAIITWFDQQVSLGQRAIYKTTLLGAAIEKATLGYQPSEDVAVSDFWRSYWLLAAREAPELEMQEPGPKPAGSTFIYFRPPVLEFDTYIVHKMTYGNLDLQFYRMGTRLSDLRARFGPCLESGMSLQRAHQSAVIRLKVPKLNPGLSFDEQLAHIRICLEQGKRLLQWYQSVKDKAV